MKTRPHFYLRDRRCLRSTGVLLVLVFGHDRIKIHSGIHVPPRLWNFNRERMKSNAAGATQINDLLEEMSGRATALLYRLKREGIVPTAKTFREAWDELVSGPKQPTQILFEDVRKEWDAEQDEAQTMTQGSRQVYNATFKHVSVFSKTYLSEPLPLERLDRLFIEAFGRYLFNVAQLNNTSAWKVLAKLKTFMMWADRRGYPVSPDHRHIRRANLPSGEHRGKSDVSLTEDEYRRIRDLDLSDLPALARSRDAFIFQINTRLRWSDMQALRHEHREGDSLEIVTGKNRKRVSIPLAGDALMIWDRYEGPPPATTNQYQNRALKEIAKRAGLTERIVLVDYRGTIRQERTVERWQCIGTHTAKKTGVTLLVEKDVSVDTIMATTGNNRRTIETYIRLSTKHTNESVSDALTQLATAEQSE